MPERVAAGDEQNLYAVTLFSNQPVRQHALALPHEKDIARAGLIGRAPFDAEHVPRSNRRGHARTEGAQAQTAVPRQHVGYQRRRRGRQEFFLTNRHWLMVVFALPHASAIVSNSCSRLKAGF